MTGPSPDITVAEPKPSSLFTQIEIERYRRRAPVLRLLERMHDIEVGAAIVVEIEDPGEAQV